MKTAAARWFWIGCAFEATLGLAALPVGGWLGVDLRMVWGNPGLRDILLGLAVCAPLLVLPPAVVHSGWSGFRAMRRALEQRLLPILREWSPAQQLLLSGLAGVAEEALFRGALQAGLAPVLGDLASLLLAAALFGLCHAVTGFYALLAAGMGLVLGLEWWFTGSLLAPMITHAVYDFAALIYLIRHLPVPPAGEHAREV